MSYQSFYKGDPPNATFRGRVQTFRTPGRGGTTGQRIFAIYNATGSGEIVRVNSITVDLTQTVAKAITVSPPIIRIHRFTALPTGGTELAKVAKDTAMVSNALITAWGDASADSTSGTALVVTIPPGNMITQEYAGRLITGAGYEPFDRTVFLQDTDVVLRQAEGLVLELAYTVAGQNPTTDMWLVGCDWYGAPN